MYSPFKDALYQTAVEWVLLGVTAPQEMTLEEKAYYALALELGIDDPDALDDAVYVLDHRHHVRYHFDGDLDPRDDHRIPIHRLRVGDWFRADVPGGSVLIKKGTKT